MFFNINILLLFWIIFNNVFGRPIKVQRHFVTYDNGKFHILQDINEIEHQDKIVVVADYKDSISKNGWSFLNIKSKPLFPATTQAYAAGLIEGHVTRDLITLMQGNILMDFCVDHEAKNCSKIKNFLQKNLYWMYDQISLHPNDNYWNQVKLFLVQFSGLSDGYLNRTGQPTLEVDPFGLWLLQVLPDISEISESLNVSSPIVSRMQSRHKYKAESCSALIKLLPDGSDLYAAHSTWNDYNYMLRIIKRYSFSFGQTTKEHLVPGHTVSFSSYPGFLLSMDDFYVTSSNLSVIETSISNYNKKLWKFVKPEGGVLEGIRVMVSNRLADSGPTWAKTFSLYNSGTYLNEWMVVDYKRFTPRSDPHKLKNVLIVLDNLPGHIEVADVTQNLFQNKYFPSYNIPYFPEIFKMAGYDALVREYGDVTSYEKCPRALIFHRNHTNVKDLSNMLKLMRYNNFKHDPLSRCEKCSPPYNAENAISARGDLNPVDGKYPDIYMKHEAGGGYDVKITNSAMIKNLQFLAQAGPTFDQQPPFQWSKSTFDKTVPHKGLPDIYLFKPVLVKWTEFTDR